MNTTMYVNHADKTITITKAFNKRASIYGTDEFKMLHRAIQDTGYSVIVKTIQKKSYNGLSFKRMEAYIMTQPNSEANLKEFKAVQSVATAKGAKYPLTKKWFLQTFPEYKVNEVSANETEAILNTSTHNANIVKDVAA
ncbi:hypothetical protein [Ruminococcus sp.]|uniref:hypothetical protein n=1 Tax=Ruminococcus sp. TaxID=41978 RepID=UPI002E818886|nr:hypothetical protein [Ruminococcus sp.]MEE3492184.1 hypothetical protein [Ruminococcus sp.]